MISNMMHRLLLGPLTLTKIEVSCESRIKSKKGIPSRQKCLDGGTAACNSLSIWGLHEALIRKCQDMIPER